MSRIILTGHYIKNASRGVGLVHYIATRDGVEIPKIINTNRPGAERSRFAGHGLWNGGDKQIVLSQAMDEVANHKGNSATCAGTRPFIMPLIILIYN